MTSRILFGGWWSSSPGGRPTGTGAERESSPRKRRDAESSWMHSRGLAGCGQIPSKKTVRMLLSRSLALVLARTAVAHFGVQHSIAYIHADQRTGLGPNSLEW